MDILQIMFAVIKANALVMSFLFVGLFTFLAYMGAKIFHGRIHGSAIAIMIGLVLAYIGGAMTGDSKGLASLPLFAGIGVLGGGMFRDFAIISTAFGADLKEIKKVGLPGVVSLLMGIAISFFTGVVFSYFMGYDDIISMTTIGAGVVTFVVGPVTGASLGASSDVVAISIAAGVVKSIVVMIGTPLVARFIGLDNPQSAMVYGGLMGTTSGVAAGLAATDEKLVPYGAMTATFYTGTGCLLCPSIGFLLVKAIWG